MKQSTLFAALLLAASVTVGKATADETIIRAITALPANNEITRRFQAFASQVNEAGVGVVQIQVIGGPEAIPAAQQDTALRNGVVDMQAGPSGNYSGIVPEANALQGATVSATEARANGAFDLLNEAWNAKLDAELIGWIGNGLQYHVFLTREPAFSDEGDLDLTGFNLRSVPTYRDWFDALGAHNVMLDQSEIYTALERGVVDGFGWIAIAEDLGVYELLHSRVGPAVWQANTVVMMNKAAWDGLSPDAQQIIRDAAIATEDANTGHFAEIAEREEAALEAAGVNLVTLEGEAGLRHIQKANGVVWAALESADAASAERLRPLLDPAN